MPEENSTSNYLKLKDRVLAARSDKTPMVICAGGSKQFYGRECHGELLDVGKNTGVISYEPTELVITAKAGTKLSDIEEILAEKGQMLPFEPPAFGESATLGGTVACGFSGPRRPFAGSVRDFILGVKCLTGRGEILTFGGQVMKNVAGYDTSRLMVGSLGTLAVLLEISFKVLPKPEYEISLSRASDFTTAIHDMNLWAGRSLSLSGASYDGCNFNVRMSGKKVAVEGAMKKLNLHEHADGLEYWSALREHHLDFFKTADKMLWRISVPSTTDALDLRGEWLIDWGGAQRWLKTSENMEKVRKIVQRENGHATLFRGGDRNSEVFHPLTKEINLLHRRLKQAFDPDNIFNRGRLYSDI